MWKYSSILLSFIVMRLYICINLYFLFVLSMYFSKKRNKSACNRAPKLLLSIILCRNRWRGQYCNRSSRMCRRKIHGMETCSTSNEWRRGGKFRVKRQNQNKVNLLGRWEKWFSFWSMNQSSTYLLVSFFFFQNKLLPFPW